MDKLDERVGSTSSSLFKCRIVFMKSLRNLSKSVQNLFKVNHTCAFIVHYGFWVLGVSEFLHFL